MGRGCRQPTVERLVSVRSSPVSSAGHLRTRSEFADPRPGREASIMTQLIAVATGDRFDGRVGVHPAKGAMKIIGSSQGVPPCGAETRGKRARMRFFISISQTEHVFQFFNKLNVITWEMAGLLLTHFPRSHVASARPSVH